MRDATCICNALSDSQSLLCNNFIGLLIDWMIIKFFDRKKMYKIKTYQERNKFEKFDNCLLSSCSTYLIGTDRFIIYFITLSKYLV